MRPAQAGLACPGAVEVTLSADQYFVRMCGEGRMCSNEVSPFKDAQKHQRPLSQPVCPFAPACVFEPWDPCCGTTELRVLVRHSTSFRRPTKSSRQPLRLPTLSVHGRNGGSWFGELGRVLQGQGVARLSAPAVSQCPRTNSHLQVHAPAAAASTCDDLILRRVAHSDGSIRAYTQRESSPCGWTMASSSAPRRRWA